METFSPTPSPSSVIAGGTKVRGLALGLAAIETLVAARCSQGVTQVASALGIAPSSAHDLLKALGELGFVEKDEINHRYRVSPGAFRLVHQIAEHFGPNPKIANLLPEIAARHNTGVYIHTLCGTETMLISTVGEYAPSTSLGISTPAYASAAGIMLVSQLPESHWPDFAPSSQSAALTEFTDLNPDHFYAALRRAREGGFAIAERTASIDICAIAAPISEGDAPVRFSVAFVFHHTEWATKEIESLKEGIWEAARQISAAFTLPSLRPQKVTSRPRAALS